MSQPEKPGPIFVAGIMLLMFAGLACNQKQSAPPAKPAVDPLEHANSVRIEPKHFLHKTFPVKKYSQFSFEVPPNSAIPRLQGTFRSFVAKPGEDSVSDDTTNVDFLLLNADQYQDFAHGDREGTVLYSTEPTHNHEVDYNLPPTHDNAEKYYIVFRNSPGGESVKTVEADFSLTFGS